MKKIGLLYIFCVLTSLGFAQERDLEVLSFQEYLAFVKRFHPVAGQAGLQINMGEAELLRARGGFDPRIEVDYDRKEFRGTQYYDILNSTFRVPTWYGIDLKANFEQTQGVYVNRERVVPPEGLFTAGIAMNVAQGLFINQRMAALRSARAYREQTVAEQELMVNQVLYEASLAYFEWLRVYNEVRIFEGFLENSIERFEGISMNARLGQLPAIDTVEAKISVQSRTLELEQARVALMRERLNVSNFLWLENYIPIELQPHLVPDVLLPEKVDDVLELPQEPPVVIDLDEHPRIRSMELRLEGLEIDRRVRANNLLPIINFEYNFLTSDPENLQTFNTSNYKAGVRFRMPLFLRRERGELRLAEFRIQDAEFDLQVREREIENRLLALFQELESFRLQNSLAEEVVENYSLMLAAEERRMTFGESSLFLVNTREIRLIEAQLKRNDLLTKFLQTKARLFQNLGTVPQP